MLDLQSPVPRNMSPEWVSIAFVRALCAQGGLNISSWDWDDGLDLTVGSAKKGYAGVSIRNVKFHLQLKSTSNWKLVAGKISFKIRKAKFNQLADESWDPQHLVLYTLPKTRNRWVESKDGYAAFNHCAYFFSFAGLKKVEVNDPDETMTLYIPAANRLTASELIMLYRSAARSLKK
jgi:hypothetical protein